MRRAYRCLLPELAVLALPLLLAGCSQPQAAPPAAAAGSVGGAPASASSAAPAPAPVAASPPSAAAAAPPTAIAPASAALASQETNWPGITADVLELRRRGNTLTMKVRLRNTGTKEVEPELLWDKAYVMDAANAKKYEALRDENGAYIAAVATSWNDRWHDHIQPGAAATVWAKFPAPPPDVKSVTLQLNNMPPFDDLAIQDG